MTQDNFEKFQAGGAPFRILTIGIAATALFFVLRGINLYGNGIAGLSFG